MNIKKFSLTIQPMEMDPSVLDVSYKVQVDECEKLYGLKQHISHRDVIGGLPTVLPLMFQRALHQLLDTLERESSKIPEELIKAYFSKER